MIWLMAVVSVALVALAVRHATTAPTPDRRPGEMPDVSRRELLRRMRENRERTRAVRRAYELEPWATPGEFVGLPPRVTVAEFACSGDEWVTPIVRPMGVKL